MAGYNTGLADLGLINSNFVMIPKISKESIKKYARFYQLEAVNEWECYSSERRQRSISGYSLERRTFSIA